MSKKSAEKRTDKKPDYLLLFVSGILVALGILILASISFAFSFKRFGDTSYLLKHQIIWGLIPGLVAAFVAYKIDLNLIKKYAPLLLLITLALMAMVFLPVIGSSAGGASRWIGIGSSSFQPSELLKLAFVLYLAAWLQGRAEKTKGFGQTFFAFLLVILVIAILLIFQPNISTLGIIIFTAVLMYFFANTPVWQTVSIILAGFGSLVALIHLAPYRLDRLRVFLNPDLDPMGIGYQIKQSLIAVGSGGAAGTGLGMSTQKFGFLPQSVTDSVFAIFSEETGFAGAFFLIFLFLLLLWRGFAIAKRTQNQFLKLTALGITVWIVTQSFVNIGAMIGFLPLSGIPLPFVSYGGSALIIELSALGILLNISKQR